MSIDPIFILKKALTVALMPLSLGIFLALIALFFLYRENLKRAKRYLIFAILWIMLITWAPFANAILRPLEHRYAKLEKIPNEVEYLLLLGGDRDKRAWEVLRLYHQKPTLTIITSGHSLHDSISDAKKTATKLIESGIPKSAIVMQEEAKTTFEEAVYMKKRIGAKPFILVTAAYHMPRAMQLFKKAGLNPIAAPTNFNNEAETHLFTILQSEQLKDTQRAWHEYLGMFVYKLQGRI